MVTLDEFTKADMKHFEDPTNYKAFRRAVEQDMNVSQPILFTVNLIEWFSDISCKSMHAVTIKDSEMQKVVRQTFQVNMVKRLEKRPWIADHRMYSFHSIIRCSFRFLNAILSCARFPRGL